MSVSAPYPPEKREGVDVGTAWLLLSHAAWIAIPITTVLLSKSFQHNKALAVAWLAAGVLFTIWTLYAVAMTWKSNQQVRNAVFGDPGFAFVVTLVIALAAVVIWSLVDAAQS